MLSKIEESKKLFIMYCVDYSAEELGITSAEMYSLLDKHNILNWILDNYGFYHTQGIEYMVEEIIELLNKKGGSR